MRDRSALGGKNDMQLPSAREPGVAKVTTLLLASRNASNGEEGLG